MAGVVNLHAFRHEAFTSTLTAACNDVAPAFGFHARTEAVLVLAGAFGWLVSSFHLRVSGYVEGESYCALSACQPRRINSYRGFAKLFSEQANERRIFIGPACGIKRERPTRLALESAPHAVIPTQEGSHKCSV